ncbi:sensor histidine kinase [Bartonella sp. HY406]|uniref:sensor histidine kinase n=1 Tax=Bartonella sp. HY406 TaxID=2979331 RepID=UPI0021C7169D|nr:sensor histidine kinase [Bartonella sp. HY406]UXN03706.1 sensor histidine kinase [Bartonella sp. HY406]
MAIEVLKTTNTDQEQIDGLIQAIHNADICVFYQTPDLIFQWAKNLPPQLETLWKPHCLDGDLFDAETSSLMVKAKKSVLENGTGDTVEVKIGDGAKPSWLKFSIDCHRNDKDEIIGLITTGVNVSELRQREQVLKILLREVSHRSKNLLAIMQSIASQTARFSDSVADFLKKYQGRIQSLSHSQDLVTDSNWRGALLKDLISSQATGYTEHSSGRFIIHGENPYLFPSAALHIGLAFHELIINSSSYGALASDCGVVKIDCILKTNEDNSNFIQITWQEVFNPTNLTNAGNARFGSTVLERIVPASVDGKAEYYIKNGKVNYLLNVPAANYDL